MRARRLARQPQDGDPGVALGRINQRIGEIHVQRHQRTLLRRAAAQQLRIGGAFQLLHDNGANIMAGGTERLPAALAQILIQLEFHAPAGSSGISTNRSRAISEP